MKENTWFHLLGDFHQIFFKNAKGIEQSFFYDVAEDMFYYEFNEEGMVEVEMNEVPREYREQLAKHLARYFKGADNK